MIAGIRLRFGNGPPDPEDVVQEAFRRVYEYENLSAVQNIKAFIWRTARNLVLDSKKTTKTRASFDFEIERLYFPIRGDNLSPENVVCAREQLRTINQILSRMPERRRDAFIMYRVSGLTLQTIADKFGVSVPAVRKQVATAQAELHAWFIEIEDEEV